VLDDPRRLFPTPCAIMLGVALLAWLLLVILRLDHIRFHKSWRGRLLLFQFLDALIGHCQLLLRLAQLLLGQPQLPEHLARLCF
jgi:hypothetical protein